MEKAFDWVWIDGLLYKLNKFKYPIILIKLLASYLINRHFRVSINESKSSKRKIIAGVPQGAVLGPKLFNVYLNDIPKFAKSSTAVFADDTAIYVHSYNAIIASKQIQTHVRMLEGFYKVWKIKLNEAKTEVIEYSQFKKKDTLKSFNRLRCTNIKQSQLKQLNISEYIWTLDLRF